MLAGTGHYDASTKERTIGKPILLTGQTHGVTDKDYRGRSETGLLDLLDERAEGGEHLSLGGQGTVTDDSGGTILAEPSVEKLVGDLPNFSHSHIDAEGTAGGGELGEVDPQGFLLNILVPSEKGDGGSEIPMGKRDAGIGGAGEGRGNAGNDLVGHLGLVESRHFLGATPEYKGVPTLQPEHPLALSGLLHEKFADLLLGHGVTAGLLADVDPFAILRNFFEQERVDQVVVDHDLASGHEPHRLDGDEIKVAGTGPD